ncbi:MAG: carbohydrate kinase family protein [Ktedonobacteraceae bacterium]
MSDFDVSVVGRVYIDHVFAGFDGRPALGTEIYCKNYERSVGGGAAITAYWLGTMGRHVQVACVVGHDDVQWFRDEFARAEVATGLMCSNAMNSGVTAAITLGDDREFFTNVGANEALEKYLDDDQIITRLCNSAHVHVTVPLSRRVAKRVIDRAHCAGLTVSMDIGYQPAWYSDPQNRATLHEVDFFLPNNVEAKLLGLSTRKGLREWLESDGSQVVGQVVRWVVVKHGSAGAAATSAGSYVVVKPPAVQNVDTTGAGDAFDAGFIDGFLEGGDARDWLRRGCVCGALSVGRLGGIAAAVGRDKVNMVEESTYGI